MPVLNQYRNSLKIVPKVISWSILTNDIPLCLCFHRAWFCCSGFCDSVVPVFVILLFRFLRFHYVKITVVLHTSHKVILRLLFLYSMDLKIVTDKAVLLKLGNSRSFWAKIGVSARTVLCDWLQPVLRARAVFMTIDVLCDCEPGLFVNTSKFHHNHNKHNHLDTPNSWTGLNEELCWGQGMEEMFRAV